VEKRLKTDWKCNYFRYNAKGEGYGFRSSDIQELSSISRIHKEVKYAK